MLAVVLEEIGDEGALRHGESEDTSDCQVLLASSERRSTLMSFGVRSFGKVVGLIASSSFV